MNDEFTKFNHFLQKINIYFARLLGILWKHFKILLNLVYAYLFDVKYYVSIFNLDISQWQKHIFIKKRDTLNSSISHEIDIIIEFWLEKKLHFVVRIWAYSIESWLILFSCFQLEWHCIFFLTYHKSRIPIFQEI